MQWRNIIPFCLPNEFFVYEVPFTFCLIIGVKLFHSLWETIWSKYLMFITLHFLVSILLWSKSKCSNTVPPSSRIRIRFPLSIITQLDSLLTQRRTLHHSFYNIFLTFHRINSTNRNFIANVSGSSKTVVISFDFSLSLTWS